MMGIGMRVGRIVTSRIAISIVYACLLHAATPEYERARELYHRTAYRESLAVLQASPVHLKDAAAVQLIGQNYFMLAEYKKSAEALEKAAAMAPADPQTLYWLGRAWCRRAETSNPFAAPGYATKARQMLEKSVALDPSNKAATGDLLDFYLGAPGFMGGGYEKAEALVKT